MMLDLPEELAPARMVRGRTSMRLLLQRDLKPSTVMAVMPWGLRFFSLLFFFAETMIKIHPYVNLDDIKS